MGLWGSEKCGKILRSEQQVNIESGLGLLAGNFPYYSLKFNMGILTHFNINLYNTH